MTAAERCCADCGRDPNDLGPDKRGCVMMAVREMSGAVRSYCARHYTERYLGNADDVAERAGV